MAMKRRAFLAGLGSVGFGFGLGGFSHLFPLASPRVAPDWSPGAEGFVPSTCLLCPSHCGILGRVVDGRLVRIDGNPLHPVSRGGLCPKGRASLQMLYHPARLKGPLERRGEAGSESFAPISWDAALEKVGAALRSLRAAGRSDAMAWVVGDVQGSMDELIARFLRVYGSPHLIAETYADGSDRVMAWTHGIQAQPAFDLDRADLVLSFGAPLSEAWWGLLQAARARDYPPQQRRRWVQIDTRLSRTAVGADQWLAVPPDTYGDLALVIAYVLLKEGLYDAGWITDEVAGFEDWTDREGRQVPGYRSLVLRHGRPEDVAARTGLDVQEIVALAKSFGRAQRALAVWDHTVTWHAGGMATALAIHSLNVLTGSLQRAGGVYLPQSYPVRPLDEMAPAPSPEAKPSGPPLRDVDWIDRTLEDAAPPVEVLFLYLSNPVASSANPDKVRKALARIPLVISFSPFLDESARYAHLVLPDHTFLERWQDAPAPHTVPYPVWGVVQPVVPPLHATRATGDVLLDLAFRVGGTVASALPWPTMENLVKARGTTLSEIQRGSAFVPGLRLDELREMEARGWWIPHGQDPAGFWTSLTKSGGWFDPYYDDVGRLAASRRPDGRVALFPEEARAAISRTAPGLAEGFLPTPAGGGGREADASRAGDARTVLLMPYRVLTLASGTTPLMPWLLEDLGPLGAWEPWVEMNPRTARELGVASARKVRVTSDHGGFTARLHLFEGAQPGILNAPYGLHSKVDGWGRFEPFNPLTAVGPMRDPVTGLPDWYSTRVRVEAA
jgi:anaerobic selenocysteine-containing dehydrogenase